MLTFDEAKAFYGGAGPLPELAAPGHTPSKPGHESAHSAKRRGQNARDISGLHEALHAVSLVSLAARPLLSFKALLRQPGGFEGFGRSAYSSTRRTLPSRRV